MSSLTPAEPLPLFPAAGPQDLRQASERLIQFWTGALLPLWTPFWAASAFGIGAWSVTRSMDRAGLFKADIPKVVDFAVFWPGYGPKPAETQEAAAAVTEAADAIIESAAETVAEVVSTVEAAADSLADSVQIDVPEAEEAEVFIDPVTATPVVPEVVEALAEPAPPPVEAVVEPVIEEVAEPVAKPVVKATPKDLARDLAVAKAAEPAPKPAKPNRPRPKA